MTFVVEQHEGRERLDRFLATRLAAISRMRLRQSLDEGGVRVNGEPQAAGWRVETGDVVEVDLDPATETAMTPEPIPLDIIHEDDCLLVVDKPAGMVVHPAGRHRSGTLVNALAYHLNVAGRAEPPIRPGLVHRLDRATSGLMVIAKTQHALSRLTVEFQQKRVEKGYVALVYGRLAEERGQWEAPIGSDPEATPRWGIRETGRPAATRFAVCERFPAHTLLDLEPVTGRTNQLRLHCAHFGHPIVGDELFGQGEEAELGRLFLHAASLRFRHPMDGELRRFEAPLPAVLRAFLDRCRSG